MVLRHEVQPTPLHEQVFALKFLRLLMLVESMLLALFGHRAGALAS